MYGNYYGMNNYQAPYYPFVNPMADNVRSQQTTQQAPIQTQPQPNNNGLIWVQGEAGAKSYLVAPNTTVMLMDSESSKFYLKSTDASGMPLPLRTFEYSETTANGSTAQNLPSVGALGIDFDQFVTRDELNGILENFNTTKTSSKKAAEKTAKENE